MKHFNLLILLSLSLAVSFQQNLEELTMPFLFTSFNGILNTKDDLYSNKEQLLEKYLNSLEAQNYQQKTIVFNIRCPIQNVFETIQFIKKNYYSFQLFSSLFKKDNAFSAILSYESSSFIKNLRIGTNNKLELHNIEMYDVLKLKSLLRQYSSDDFAIFLLFEQDHNIKFAERKRILETQTVKADPNTPSMVQIQPEALFGLLLLFLLFLPVLYVGIGQLFALQSNDKFAVTNLNVGKEY